LKINGEIMNSNELKALQEPLKNKYKENPEAAIVTLSAKSRISDGITCKVETGKTIVKAGLHPATGGDGLSACSGDMLLEALAACAGVTLRAVSTAIDFDLQDATVNVEGDLDFRGTLAVDREAPVGFKNIRVSFDLKTTEDSEKIKTLIKLTERYCVVLQTIKKGTEIEVRTPLN
jgi:uncharacterized OsmC-like protein